MSGIPLALKSQGLVSLLLETRKPTSKQLYTVNNVSAMDENLSSKTLEGSLNKCLCLAG